MPRPPSEQRTLRKIRRLLDQRIIEVLRDGREVPGADGSTVRVTATASDLNSAISRLKAADALTAKSQAEQREITRMREAIDRLRNTRLSKAAPEQTHGDQATAEDPREGQSPDATDPSTTREQEIGRLRTQMAAAEQRQRDVRAGLRITTHAHARQNPAA